MVKVLTHVDLNGLKKKIIRASLFGAAVFTLFVPREIVAQTHMQHNNPQLPTYAYSTDIEKEVAFANMKKAEEADSLRAAHMGKKAQDTVNRFKEQVKSVHEHAMTAHNAAKKMIDMYKKSGGTFESEKVEKSVRLEVYHMIKKGAFDPRAEFGGIAYHDGKYYVFSQEDVVAAFGIPIQLVRAIGY